jgi:hypothetical protein
MSKQEVLVEFWYENFRERKCFETFVGGGGAVLHCSVEALFLLKYPVIIII